MPEPRPAGIQILPVTGLPEIRPGDDLTALVAERAGWLRAGDVLVMTSKAVSKAEGRLVAVGSDDPAERERVRQYAIDRETTRVVARRGPFRIVADRRGLVLAGAGVDESNVARDEIALLPEHPDASARRLRDGLRARLGVEVGVVVSDSMGRPWRTGIVDQAIGVAGLHAVHDLRGHQDRHGNALVVTEVAVADEIAAAADLVKGKLNDVPAAVVRGLTVADDERGSAPLRRPPGDDLFRLGTAEALAIGREDAGGALVAPGPLHADARAVVSRLHGGRHPSQDALREAFLSFLDARPDALRRSCVPGHVTASAVVLDPSRQSVLLTLHPRVGRWVQLGGHCEPGDLTLLDSAAREAREESGIGSLSLDPEPLSLDVHAVTCSLGVPTRHFDVRFLAVAPEGAEPVISAESIDLKWFRWDALPPESVADLSWVLEQARYRLSQ